MAMVHLCEHAAPRPVQHAILILDRHHTVGRMLVVAGIGCEVVRWSRVCTSGPFPARFYPPAFGQLLPRAAGENAHASRLACDRAAGRPCTRSGSAALRWDCDW